jgi:hypothetical protein
MSRHAHVDVHGSTHAGAHAYARASTHTSSLRKHQAAPISFADRMEDDRDDDAVVASNEEMRDKLKHVRTRVGVRVV